DAIVHPTTTKIRFISDEIPSVGVRYVKLLREGTHSKAQIDCSDAGKVSGNLQIRGIDFGNVIVRYLIANKERPPGTLCIANQSYLRRGWGRGGRSNKLRAGRR